MIEIFNTELQSPKFARNGQVSVRSELLELFAWRHAAGQSLGHSMPHDRSAHSKLRDSVRELADKPGGRQKPCGHVCI